MKTLELYLSCNIAFAGFSRFPLRVRIRFKKKTLFRVPVCV